MKTPQQFDEESTPRSTSTTTTQIHEFDVLTGRDRLAHSHSGNRYFRLLCATHKEAYQQAKRRRFKTEIIQQIIAAVKERDGRFLTLDESSPGAIAWAEMDAPAVHQKVSHALRSGKKSSSLSKSPSSTSRPGSGSATPEGTMSRSLQRLSIRQSVTDAQALFSQSLPNLNFAEGERLLRRLCNEGERRSHSSALAAAAQQASLKDDESEEEDDDDSSSSSDSISTDGPHESESEVDESSCGGEQSGANHAHDEDAEDADEEIAYLRDVLLLSGQEESTSTSSATFYTIDGKKAEF